MHTSKPETQQFLRDAWRYMQPDIFEGAKTSRSLKCTQLSQTDINEAVDMGKFERCDPREMRGTRLPDDWNGVNVFTVPELKGRRRLITEPLLNAVVNRKTIPHVSYPSRLARRQSLRYCKYMLQIDFEAFYDAIPIPLELRNKFVFRKGKDFYRLRTLPTGARWSVAVGQAITWTIVDIGSPVTILTMIDNIMIAATAGQELDFVQTVRTIVERIREANLMTSPNRETLLAATDDELLKMGMEPNTFLGEEYAWNGQERLIRNSTKTVAKLGLALRATEFSCRSFVSLISLILYALHTTRLNPASAFTLLRAYRGVYRSVTEGKNWDGPLVYLDAKVRDKMLELGYKLYNNDWWQIADVVEPTYEESYYDYIAVTDASYAGWGSYVQRAADGCVTGYQQKWEKQDRNDRRPYVPTNAKQGFFDAQHSAHAEPRAVEQVLRCMIADGMENGARVAVITDHEAIVHAQRRTNGFGALEEGTR
eukprot:gene4533-biopygen2553